MAHKEMVKAQREKVNVAQNNPPYVISFFSIYTRRREDTSALEIDGVSHEIVRAGWHVDIGFVGGCASLVVAIEGLAAEGLLVTRWGGFFPARAGSWYGDTLVVRLDCVVAARVVLRRVITGSWWYCVSSGGGLVVAWCRTECVLVVLGVAEDSVSGGFLVEVWQW
ncbi:hypothetical protein Droror1_Dr00000189 [Drosera rotundifolia]